MASIKERVYAAAEKIGEDRTPTVTAVREAAGVSMADASRYLKEWKSDREAATRQIIAAPPTMIEHGQRLAAAIWDEAIKLASERHGADHKKWEEERAVLTAEVADLVAAADGAEAAHSLKAEKDAQALSEARTEMAVTATALEDARAEAAATAEENADLRGRLAAVQATADTLQKSLDAVIAKISPGKSAHGRSDPKS